MRFSSKWRDTTAPPSSKVTFEFISLVQAFLDSNGEYAKAYIVLGGEDWKLPNFYTGGGRE